MSCAGVRLGGYCRQATGDVSVLRFSGEGGSPSTTTNPPLCVPRKASCTVCGDVGTVSEHVRQPHTSIVWGRYTRPPKAPLRMYADSAITPALPKPWLIDHVVDREALAMQLTLRLGAEHDVVARWLSDVTIQMEQSHGQDEYVPFTPGPEEQWDYEKNAYTGFIRVQIGLATPEPLASDPRVRSVIFDECEIIRFELDQLAPGTACLRIIYFEQTEESFGPFMVDYFREYLRQIVEAWPTALAQLQQQSVGFEKAGIAAVLESLVTPSSGEQADATDNDTTQIPDHGYDREMLKLWRAGYTAPEISRKIAVLGVPTAKTIRNRMSVLRKIYGKEVVPYRRRT